MPGWQLKLNLHLGLPNALPLFNLHLRPRASFRLKRVLDKPVGQSRPSAVFADGEASDFIPRPFIKILFTFTPLAITQNMRVTKDHGVNVRIVFQNLKSDSVVVWVKGDFLQ